MSNIYEAAERMGAFVEAIVEPVTDSLSEEENSTTATDPSVTATDIDDSDPLRAPTVVPEEEVVPSPWFGGAWTTLTGFVETFLDTFSEEETPPESTDATSVQFQLARVTAAHRRLSEVLVEVMKNPPEWHSTHRAELQTLLEGMRRVERSMEMLEKVTSDADHQRTLQWHLTLCRVSQTQLREHVEATTLPPPPPHHIEERALLYKQETWTRVVVLLQWISTWEAAERKLWEGLESGRWCDLSISSSKERLGVTSRAIDAHLRPGEVHFHLNGEGGDDWVLLDKGEVDSL